MAVVKIDTTDHIILLLFGEILFCILNILFVLCNEGNGIAIAKLLDIKLKHEISIFPIDVGPCLRQTK